MLQVLEIGDSKHMCFSMLMLLPHAPYELPCIPVRYIGGSYPFTFVPCLTVHPTQIARP